MQLPSSIRNRMGVKLHCKKGHPISNLRKEIEAYFGDWHKFHDLDPVVSVEDNFDKLLIPTDHPSRRTSDTYYVTDKHVLRTHTSAHQAELLAKGYKKFLVTGDVYRKDEIDRTHYPIFHQVEGVYVVRDVNNIETRLHNKMIGMLNFIMGEVEVRKVESYFPFTEPSWEYEVFWEGRWLEIAGCGIIRQEILKNCGVEGIGYAFGMGLERVAMALHKIPDIRLFWSNDDRFLRQFELPHSRNVFKEFSDQPACFKDIAFWTKEEFPQTELFQLIRDIAGDLVEDVKCVDTYNTGTKTSLCYRITYRAMDRTLTNEEINTLQDQIRVAIPKTFKVELR